MYDGWAVASMKLGRGCCGCSDGGGGGRVAGSLASASRRTTSRRRRFIPPFHQFFTALSLRPGSCLAISAQRLPRLRTSCSIFSPSSGVMGSCLRVCFKFWWYRSRHCFGDLDVRAWEILTQFEAPFSLTRLSRRASSSADHGPLLSLLFDMAGSTQRNAYQPLVQLEYDQAIGGRTQQLVAIGNVGSCQPVEFKDVGRER